MQYNNEVDHYTGPTDVKDVVLDKDTSTKGTLITTGSRIGDWKVGTKLGKGAYGEARLSCATSLKRLSVALVLAGLAPSRSSRRVRSIKIHIRAALTKLP